MKFILLYKGPATPLGASHKGWMTFFASLGEALVDIGSPTIDGVVVHNDGSTTELNSKATLNGYSVIRAKDRNEALEIIKDHPYLKLGKDYTIEVIQRRK